MKSNAVAFSVFVAVIISVFLVFSIFGILYFYWGDVSAVKDSFSTVAGFFGGFATLGAAVIAGYLFNGWKDQHNKNIDAQMCMKTFDLFQSFEFELLEIRTFAMYFLNSPVKIHLYDQFNANLDRLNKLADETTIVLSNLGYFIPASHFDTKFKPQFNNLLEDLESYIETYDKVFRHYQNNKNHEKFIKKYFDLSETLRARYRATCVELREYYKALN